MKILISGFVLRLEFIVVGQIGAGNINLTTILFLPNPPSNRSSLISVARLEKPARFINPLSLAVKLMFNSLTDRVPFLERRTLTLKGASKLENEVSFVVDPVSVDPRNASSELIGKLVTALDGLFSYYEQLTLDNKKLNHFKSLVEIMPRPDRKLFPEIDRSTLYVIGDEAPYSLAFRSAPDANPRRHYTVAQISVREKPIPWLVELAPNFSTHSNGHQKMLPGSR